jgi:hypothetical protein
MSDWSLQTLLASLHDDIEKRLEISRLAMGHPVSKGDASEAVWLEMLKTYLPERYRAAKAHVVDSQGNFSQQIDVVVFDRQYTPFIFKFQDQTIIPAEGVYAVFEAKQEINAKQVAYAQEKVASVRNLHRTSLPIPYAKGTYPPKPLIPILGGILTFESSWSPPLGNALLSALANPQHPGGELDLGCVAASGHFARNVGGTYDVHTGGKPATAFLFNLIAQLQFSGTVPMIDVGAYAAWLTR